MKATLFAIALLFFVVSLPALAGIKKSLPIISVQAEPSTGKINLNKADVQVLTKSIKGIGKKRAEAIVNYRKAHGHFKSLRELALIKGIGKSFVNKNLYQLQKVFMVG